MSYYFIKTKLAKDGIDLQTFASWIQVRVKLASYALGAAGSTPIILFSPADKREKAYQWLLNKNVDALDFAVWLKTHYASSRSFSGLIDCVKTLLEKWF